MDKMCGNVRLIVSSVLFVHVEQRFQACARDGELLPNDVDLSKRTLMFTRANATKHLAHPHQQTRYHGYTSSVVKVTQQNWFLSIKSFIYFTSPTVTILNPKSCLGTNGVSESAEAPDFIPICAPGSLQKESGFGKRTLPYVSIRRDILHFLHRNEEPGRRRLNHLNLGAICLGHLRQGCSWFRGQSRQPISSDMLG